MDVRVDESGSEDRVPFEDDKRGVLPSCGEDCRRGEVGGCRAARERVDAGDFAVGDNDCKFLKLILKERSEVGVEKKMKKRRCHHPAIQRETKSELQCDYYSLAAG